MNEMDIQKRAAELVKRGVGKGTAKLQAFREASEKDNREERERAWRADGANPLTRKHYGLK